MTKPDDDRTPQDEFEAKYPPDVREMAEKVMAANHAYLSFFICDAILAERERIAIEAEKEHDRYMNSAGWFRDANSDWQHQGGYAAIGGVEVHNAAVSRANAMLAFAAAIRSPS